MLRAVAAPQRNKRTARKPLAAEDLTSYCLVQGTNRDSSRAGRSPLGTSVKSALVAGAGERSCERQLVLEASEEVEGVREWDTPGRRYLGEDVVTGAG